MWVLMLFVNYLYLNFIIGVEINLGSHVKFNINLVYGDVNLSIFLLRKYKILAIRFRNYKFLVIRFIKI